MVWLFYIKPCSNHFSYHHKNMKSLFLSISAVLLVSIGAMAQTYDYNEDYNQARKFTAPKLASMLFSTTVDPHWTPRGDAFWYSYKTSKGTKWYLVNPATKQKRLLFDQEKLAAELTEIMHDPFIAEKLPIENLKAQTDGTFTFEVISSQEKKAKPKNPNDSTSTKKPKAKPEGKEIFYFSYNPTSRKLTRIEREYPETYPDWASISPDGQTVVYAKDFNLYRISRAEYEQLKENERKPKAEQDAKLDSLIVGKQLTTFGEKDFGFAMPYSYLNTDTLANGKRKGEWSIVWSPDSRHFAVQLDDNRKVKELWVVNSMASPRPTLETYKYEMPGDTEIPQAHLYIFDMQNDTYKEILTSRFKDQSLSLGHTPIKEVMRDQEEVSVKWLGDNNSFFVTRSSRDLHRIDICRYVIGEDSIRTLVEERMNTYQEVRPLELIGGGKEFVQWSERNGWAHLYLYDANGKLKNAITSGAYHVHRILGIDEASRTIYFTAMGKNPKENPYYQHVYRVSLSGGEPKEISAGEYFHSPRIDDKLQYFVDNYSRIDCQPKTALYSTSGAKVMDLEEADMSQLLAAGYQYPEQFCVKAADGVTDLWGVMYKPFNFDPEKKYPIIDYVYPGPQVEATYYPFTRMSPRTDRLAQAGFIVISVGNRGGHPDRSKWYHNYGYGNLRDYGLADQKAAIEQLANKYNFIDINKVGIHGHSGGGFMSTAAILQYPDFFKAAVSCAGNHDNRIYNRWWSETHHGVKEKVSEQGDTTFVYNISTNPEIAKRLKGHLLLIHGDIDNNVHPGNTLRVVDALIRAGKRFDMLMLPQQRHGFGNMNEYFYWRLVDYFTEHLKGKPEDLIDIPELAK